MKGFIGSFFYELYIYNDVNYVVENINDIILRIFCICFFLIGVFWLLIVLLMVIVCRKKKFKVVK